MFSRFSAAAIASTLSAVTGSHLRSLGSKASNPPLRQALIHRRWSCADLHAPAARPGVHLPAMPRTTRPRCLVVSPSSSAGPISRYRNNATSCALARRSSRSCSAKDTLGTSLGDDRELPGSQGGARQRLCHRRTRVDRAGRPGRASSPHRDSRAASCPGDNPATTGHRPGIC